MTPRIVSVDTSVIEHLPGTSLRARLLALATRLTARQVLRLFGRWPALPWPFSLVDRLAVLLPPVPGVTRKLIDLGGCRAELIMAPQARHASGAILYTHGGGFLTCGLNTHRRLVSRLSMATGMPILSVDYRRPPNVPLAASIADCVRGYNWLAHQGYSSIALAGDSAGSYLAIMVALSATEGPRPSALLCLSPMLDLESVRAEPRRGRDPLFPASCLNALGTWLVRRTGPTDMRLPTPLSADLSSLPPTLVLVGASELLAEDSIRLARRLNDCGVPCRLQLWEGQMHVFPAFAEVVPEGRIATAQAAEFLTKATEQPLPTRSGAA
ncbi:Acetyl esterase/lipase [Nocardia farcinica]|uniref:Monoterpene epsilon-lactone hydrolase n=1 Tax=Nocardia farcinica TaxID=37329 RepID=A0A0H5NS31_NOCFR|nr:alpha/beta hydrolase fold domain-containing protein [Nocardia farcinica]AXK85845.1 esterase [Nocardia farcinica]MBA4859191.1 alpha/beta hydrolase fold domain-containing protein [Nocardia farcinica]MBC9819027.1 alpha/beta hydrolase fold domain-containing protein [Nocardia farcinica]PFW98769.1 Carboxylesterase LipF [Nocardia farcinica]PFX04390.1 Carboxylesterase LipF [Nocardia farcinica]